MIDPAIIEDEKSLARNCEVCDTVWKSTYLGINTQGSIVIFTHMCEHCGRSMKKLQNDNFKLLDKYSWE
jgi:hypothetical protein